MGNPHKYAAVIKAWADGAVIEYLALSKKWVAITHPSWDEALEYRVQPPPPHKWQKEMDAQAAGKKVQYREPPGVGRWIDNTYGNYGKWKFDSPTAEYRIKPEEVELFGCAVQTTETSGCLAGGFLRAKVTQHANGPCNLKLTFEDGKLIKAEVL